MVKYTIEYAPDFDKKYLKSIHPEAKERINKYIQQRIASDPHQCGEHLKGNYSGMWRARCGDYRIIYSIFEERVLVLVIKVGHRKDVYQ